VEDNFGAGAAPKGKIERTFKYFTPRAIATFKPTQDIMVYASASKGVKSGGFNPNAPRVDERTYFPEKNWTYEAGTKLNLWDQRAFFSASVYRIDWTNQQTLVFARDLTGATIAESIIGNVAKSRVNGFELQLTVAPVDVLKLDASYGFTDAKYKDAVLSDLAGFVDCAVLRAECAVPAGGGAPQTTGRVNGNVIEYVPKHTLSVGAELTLPINDVWSFFSRGDVSYVSRKFVDSGNNGWVPGREEVGLRVGVQTDTMRFQAFCNNLTNDRTPITGFAPRDFLGNPHYFVTNRDGRICGLTVSVSN
jgi:iron complex outermembrane receptor protein